MNTQHARRPSRRLAHSLLDEVVPRQAEPYRETWRDGLRDAFEIVAGVVILLTLFISIPWLAWLVAG